MRAVIRSDRSVKPGEPLSLTVTLPNEQQIKFPEAVVRWSRGQEFAVETVVIEPHIQARLAHYVKRLVLEPLGGVIEMGQRLAKGTKH